MVLLNILLYASRCLLYVSNISTRNPIILRLFSRKLSVRLPRILFQTKVMLIYEQVKWLLISNTIGYGLCVNGVVYWRCGM